MQIEHYSRQKRLSFRKKANIPSVHITSGDYQNVEILPDSVIYCDIPYHNTNVYDTENAFDYDRFYEWALKQTQPLFISEYWMPESDFECIKEIKHNSIMSATANNVVIEKIFIPRTQKYNKVEELSLF